MPTFLPMVFLSTFKFLIDKKWTFFVKDTPVCMGGGSFNTILVTFGPVGGL